MSGLNHVSGITFYNRVGLDRLEANFRHQVHGEPSQQPLQNGLVHQWFRYGNLASNTTPATEGTVGTSVTIQSSTVSATVAQYVDFVNFSDLIAETAIDPIVENGARLLGYRLGLTVDTLVRTEIETVNSSVDEDTVGSYASAQDLRKIRALLQAANVQPKPGGYFMATASPYVTYDIVNDPTAGGFIDASKYTRPERLESMQDRGLIGRMGGVELWESTNVATSGSSPNTKYHMTISGQGALGIVDLAGKGVSGFRNNSGSDGLPIRIVQGGPQIADPAGVVAAAASYNVKFVTKLLRTGSDDYRLRIVEADSSITT